jgi:hypothetical protein
MTLAQAVADRASRSLLITVLGPIPHPDQDAHRAQLF